ncbi:prefoldin subunit 2, putative [Plasmodium chabaudi chabaudi]|uniref:Prefoldin subunit 2, putative n=2 Tax=Plasmodium chabaudi TaxID=5825 RepID=A0A077YI20_PLACU|nr:prefoldin subunit 2, putative [Plasmodium chabaudi chabaudi]SCM07865.1 prefoldin subunit 2, putative [Plasmodium chabaudi adami]SCM02659.1 prefoldin subunit 2, putative [Plasmodium chabaudi chabaudi]SCM05094.1 prefoldin subunit 2, putative [Plasmodium chabaudi chabaudi]SCM10993.1 prefoldin subunit 2, putative [Plasmodium chabaudi adami]VTZ66602.1 prefoldin subunit 2, putative [Plasmodium chabaudi chabaudi]|eukprot:XP_016655615.1 prefoldin subunit 2, putative [Plasmodium chabaudi chabaudi]
MENKSSTTIPKPNELAESKLTYEQIEKDRVQLVSKIEELYQDVVEHKLVLEALENVPSDRRCYRMVGDILVERTVGEIKPALIDHKNKVEQIIAECQKKLDEKNIEVSQFLKSAKSANPSNSLITNKS